MNFSLLCFLSLSLFGASQPVDLTRSLEELNTQGFTVIPDLFNESEVKEICERYQIVKERALEIVQASPPVVRTFSENNVTNTTKYWQKEHEVILQAGNGRYDFYRGFSKTLLSPASINETLETLMQKLMVDEFTCYSGIIHSTPGSEDQYWHRDTHTLETLTSEGTNLVNLDDFYFTVLIPITVPFTIENGTTEFMVGSHKLAAKDLNECKTSQLEVPLGSALVFNGKINHRGKANQSLEDRPALYIVYHKKWYNDQYRKGVPD